MKLRAWFWKALSHLNDNSEYVINRGSDTIIQVLRSSLMFHPYIAVITFQMLQKTGFYGYSSLHRQDFNSFIPSKAKFNSTGILKYIFI